MTNPIDVGPISLVTDIITNADLAVRQRPEYFQQVPLVPQTIARAEDLNRMQRNIDEGLDRFGSDVSFALDQTRMAVVAFANRMAQRQTDYERAISAEVQAFEARVLDEISQWKAYADAGDARTLTEAVKRSKIYTDGEIAAAKVELKAYADEGDARTLEEAVARAKAYTDAEISKAKAELNARIDLEIKDRKADTRAARTEALMAAWDACRFTHKVIMAGINDGSNYWGGKPWGITTLTVPSDTYIGVTTYAMEWLDVGDVGGAADEFQVSWTPFFGLQTQAPGGNIYGTGSASPAWALPPLSNPSAFVYINNLKAVLAFTVTGYMVPSRLLDAIVNDPGFPRGRLGVLAPYGAVNPSSPQVP